MWQCSQSASGLCGLSTKRKKRLLFLHWNCLEIVLGDCIEIRTVRSQNRKIEMSILTVSMSTSTRIYYILSIYLWLAVFIYFIFDFLLLHKTTSSWLNNSVQYQVWHHLLSNCSECGLINVIFFPFYFDKSMVSVKMEECYSHNSNFNQFYLYNCSLLG